MVVYLLSYFWICLFQSFAWSSCSEWSVGLRVPFVVDVCPMTFEQLDLLLRQVSEGMDGSSDWPPPQEKECMVVATLNLLRLQVTRQTATLFCLIRLLYLFYYIRFINFFVVFFCFKFTNVIFLLSSMQPSVIRWIQTGLDLGLAASC